MGVIAVGNLGSGNGFSVMEIIQKAREVTGREIKAVMADRRPGDPTSGSGGHPGVHGADHGGKPGR